MHFHWAQHWQPGSIVFPIISVTSGAQEHNGDKIVCGDDCTATPMGPLRQFVYQGERTGVVRLADGKSACSVDNELSAGVNMKTSKKENVTRVKMAVALHSSFLGPPCGTALHQRLFSMHAAAGAEVMCIMIGIMGVIMACSGPLASGKLPNAVLQAYLWRVMSRATRQHNLVSACTCRWWFLFSFRDISMQLSSKPKMRRCLQH